MERYQTIRTLDCSEIFYAYCICASNLFTFVNGILFELLNLGSEFDQFSSIDLSGFYVKLTVYIRIFVTFIS